MRLPTLCYKECMTVALFRPERKVRRVALAILLWLGLTGETFFACRTGGGDAMLGQPFNRAPVAQDGVSSTTVDVAISGILVASDPDGDDLTYTITSGPSLGVVQLVDASTGEYTYLSATAGSDNFSFLASDGRADSNTATVSITVLATRIAWVEKPAGAGSPDLCKEKVAENGDSAFAVDPFDSSHRLRRSKDGELEQSRDGGLTWYQPAARLLSGEPRIIRFSADEAGLIYIVAARDPGTRVVRHDYGRGWQIVGDTEFAIESLRVGPVDAVGATKLDVCAKSKPRWLSATDVRY